ncbi:MAG: flagellar motor switch protein FliM [Phycisphaerae bacterium]
MSEVLDQNDIDALLASVAHDPGAGGEGLGDAPAGSDAGPARYDFKRPERVGKDQIRALSAIHEVFARNFGATLSGLLRTITEVRVVGVEQLTYNEYIHTLPNPTCFLVLQAPPLEGQMCMEISPLIVCSILDRLLGGAATNVFIPQRPLTSIEWRLVSRIVERALDHLSEVWHNLIDLRYEIVHTESNPQLVHIVAPSEVVVFITFELKLGGSAGTMGLCVPYNTIESVLSRLTTQAWFYKPRAATDNQLQRLTRNLARSTVRLSAFLGRTTIRLSELRDLRVGDLLDVEKRVGREMIVRIEGRNKFAGLPGQLRGRRAVRITRAAQADEPL